MMESREKRILDIFSIVGLLLPVIALAAGVFLVTQPQNLEKQAKEIPSRTTKKVKRIEESSITRPRAIIDNPKELEPKKPTPPKALETLKPSRGIEEGRLVGKLKLEGRREKPPSQQYVVNLIFRAKLKGAKYSRYNLLVTSDENGIFRIKQPMKTGEYEVLLKGTHTLAVKKSITIIAGENNVVFGPLPEGDANNDNVIDGKDFDILRKAFNKREGQAGYDRRADFNQDGRVDILDFSLMAKNWQKKGANL